MKITINPALEQEARNYATLSRSFTSDRHDFHEGGLSAKQRKMFEGKLGEKAIQQFFVANDIKFVADSSSHEQADLFDFIVYDLHGNPLKVDVKTRTKKYHTRTLEMVEQMTKKPKDIYFSVQLYATNPFTVALIGYALKEDFLTANRIENLGYLDNYVLYDSELKTSSTIIDLLQKNS